MNAIDTLPKATQTQANPHLAEFERFQNEFAGNEPSWLAAIREKALDQFTQSGYPTLKDENWRFTNVSTLTRLPFRPVFELPAHDLTRKTLEHFNFAGLKSSRLVFVDGHYSQELSNVLPLPSGVQVMSLAAAVARQDSVLEANLTKFARTSETPFAALNTAFFTDGVFIHVPAGKAVPDPVQLVYISTAGESSTAIHPRNLIVVEANGSVTVVEQYISVGTEPTVTNAVSEFVLGDNAVVEHCKFQDEHLKAFHLSMLQVQLGRSTNFISHSIAAGAQLSRNNINTVLAGEGIECILNGLYVTKEDQLADHFMIVDHTRPHCNSHEYFNGILDSHSRGVFHGRILVRQAAQKTDAKQTNKNLLLSDTATVDTKPQLEIYADDVKCTHGATVGQLNEESIFYLRARGIGLETARRMLIHAFAGEIIDRVRCAPLREELDRIVWDRLEQHPHLAEQ